MLIRFERFSNRSFSSFLAEFQEAFNLFDNRGDGKIQQNQIGECLRALGQNPTESDVKKFTHQLKPDERISFEVFLPIYQVRSGIDHRMMLKPLKLAGNLEAAFWRHCRRLHRGTASLRQGRFRLHLISRAATFADDSRREAERRGGRAVAEQSGRLAGQRELRGIRQDGHERLNARLQFFFTFSIIRENCWRRSENLHPRKFPKLKFT